MILLFSISLVVLYIFIIIILIIIISYDELVNDTSDGKNVIRRRRQKGRHKLTVSDK